MNFEVAPSQDRPQYTSTQLVPTGSAPNPSEDGPTNPRSICSLLSLLPSGGTPGPLSFDELGQYLAATVGTQEEKKRNERHEERDQMYRDGGIQVMNRLLDELFRDPDVRELRKKMVPIARFNNALKRIVNELSTVYAKPAKRKIAVDNERYQAALEAVLIDERMQQLGRLLNLHRQLLVGIRVRNKPDGTREPVIDIATPAKVRAIVHPNDSTLVIGWMIRTDYRTAQRNGEPQVNKPAWTVWTDYEVFQLRDSLTVITESYATHPLGLMPWVPVSLSPPEAGFWCGDEGEDLVSAHKALWFINVLAMKETKSATKQTILKGDGTNTARGQAADSEIPGELSDGQSATTVDMSMDLEMFNTMSDHVLQHGAQNYGMSPAIITHQGVQSAEARNLMRVPLKEIREQQQIPLRRFEFRLALTMAAVFKHDLPDLAFDATGWAIEFGEPETPLSKADDHNLFVARRQAGLTNSLDYMCTLYNITPDEASVRLVDNYAKEEARLELAKPLAALSGGMAGVNNSGSGGEVVPPEQQGAAPRGAQQPE